LVAAPLAAITLRTAGADKLGAPVRNTYLVCYDISNDLRLRRVHKTMCGFGDRLQYSVFECRFGPADLARCRHALGKIIHHREDQVLFVDLGPVEGRGDRVITSLGRVYSALDSPCIVVDGEETAGEARGTRRSVEALERARRKRAFEQTAGEDE
jgi:CRISPR-associated protein Cas2